MSDTTSTDGITWGNLSRDQINAVLQNAKMPTIETAVAITTGNPFLGHAGVDDLDKFRQWLDMRHEEAVKLRLSLEHKSGQESELYEWTIAHCAALSEVKINFDKAMRQTDNSLPAPVPKPGTKVKALLKHWETWKIEEAVLISSDEDDCDWRVAECGSEVSHAWNVVYWEEIK